jgi:hypothetical protein
LGGPSVAQKEETLEITSSRLADGLFMLEGAGGKDLKDILETPPTVELDAKWGTVFFSPEQFTEIVFQTLPPI